MKEEESSPVFRILLTLLISGGWTEGSVSRPYPVSSNPGCPPIPVSPDYCSSPSRAGVNSTLEGNAACTWTLRQHACTSDTNVTSSKLVSILRCSITDPEAHLDQEGFLVLFKSVELETLQAALDEIGMQIPRDQITPASKAFVLNAAWESLQANAQVRSTGFLASWFQESMHSYLTAINANVLDCMTQIPITCDGFTTIVQALDSVYSGMDNSTRQLVAHWIDGFLTQHKCPKSSAQEWIRSNWKSFLNYATYSDLTKAWSGFDGFAALRVLTASQLAQLTVARGVLSNANLTEAVVSALSRRDVRYTEAYLNELSTLPLEAPLDHEAIYVMLKAVLVKVNESFPDLCSPSLKDLFQVKLKKLLPVADESIMKLFPTKIGCSDFRDIYKGINAVYGELSSVTQEAVYKNRLSFLEGLLAKEGSACTFASSNSREWLQDNFGLSSSFADYADFVRLNPSFNGFEVLDLLTATQIAKLAVTSGILTDSATVNAEMEAASVIGALQSRNISVLQTFLLEVHTLAQQRNIKEVTNVRVRTILLQGIFQILKPQLFSVVTTGVGSWFNGMLTLYLPSVTAELLADVPHPSNCTELRAVVKGLDYAFEPMSLETKTAVAQWIMEGLRQTGCQTTDDGLVLNFQRFKSVVNITDLMALNQNFTGMSYLEDLSAVQLAQLALTAEVFSSVDNVKKVFARLSQLPGPDDLATYWDEFNVVYEKAKRRHAESRSSRLRVSRSLPQPGLVHILNISMEVKHVMLSKTVGWLQRAFSTFTDANYQLWFGKRLVVVLPSVTATVLRQIPPNISCGAYKSVIAGINSGFSEMPKEGKTDVFNYIISFLTQKSQTTGPACSAHSATRNWLLDYFGRFSVDASYAQLVSCYRQTFDAYAVLDLLTPSQIGDMMVHSSTLTSVSLATRLVSFFRESSIDSVQRILKAFTRAAIQRKMVALPNSEVAQLLLANYLDLASPQMETYTAAEWNSTFQAELRFLSPAVNSATLTYFLPQDYKSFAAIVAGFSGVYSQMAESSRKAVVLWIAQNLKTLTGYPVEPIAEWIRIAWGAFSQDATLEELKSTMEDFDPSSALGLLSIGQLVDFVVTSDALVNVSRMSSVLLSLETKHTEIPLAKLDGFLTSFNLVIEQGNIQGVRNAEVRTEMLSTVFRSLARHFYRFTTVDYQDWFLKKLKFLLPSINAELLQRIPLDVSFPSFSAIFGGFDRVYRELPQDTSLQIYRLMKKIMELQFNASGTVFPGAYNNSQSFLQLFHRFVHFAPYADFLALYKDFNGYAVLNLLSPKQMGEMMVLTKAFRNELLAVQILVELEKRPSAEMRDFIVEFNAAAKQRHLTVLPDLRIRDLIFEAVFKTLDFSTFSAQQFSFWFGAQLQILLPALTPKHLQLIPLDIDCQSHQNLVKAMGRAYEHLAEGQQKAVHERILSYLQSRQADQGVTCSPNDTSSQWLLSNYGRFSTFASITEFLSLNVNFNGISALAELSAIQLAELAVELGALADGSAILKIMSHLGTVGDLGRFLDKLNAIAAVEMQTSPLASSLLAIAFQRIVADFPRFKASNFAYWFQAALQNVLHAVNETLVAEIPLRMSCGSYQQILKGFNNIYASLQAEAALSVFGFSKAFLTSKVKSGVACGQPAQTFQAWLDVNLGNFSRFAGYEDLHLWNLHFDGMALLGYLSPRQLASLTLETDAINDEEKMCQVLAKLQNKPVEEMYQYLDQFNMEAQKLAIASLKEEGIRKRMLSQFVEEIGPAFSTFSPANWTHLLSTRLALFLPSFDEKESQRILSSVSSCDSFRAVVSSLSHVYPAMASAHREGVYNALFSFLANQEKTTGSACTPNTRGTGAWLQENLGAFAAQAPYEDFAKLTASFNGFEVRGNLTSTQLAHVFLDLDTLDDPETVGALLVPLDSRIPSDTLAFVTEFATVASQRGITFLANTKVRSMMFDTIFSKMQSLFSTASVSQYKDWFQSKLTLWLPSINASALAAVPKTISCGSFKTIIAGLDSSFMRMSPESRQDVYNFAKDYLAAKTSQGGDACTEDTRGSLGWLQANFGSFSSLARYKDLTGINPDFRAMDAIAGLTPAQLADFALASDVLRDSEKAGRVLGSLTSQDVGEFMDTFNAAAQEQQLAQLPSLEMRRFILGEIFCHLNGLFKLFTAQDYTTWFGERLHLFLNSLDAQNLGFLPSDMPCSSLAAIVKTLNPNSTFENPEDIFSFVKRVLHFQLQNTGSACAQGISTDRQWLTEYFGPLVAYGSYSDFAALKSSFRGEDALDFFSASTLAQLSTQTHTIYSSSAMMLVFRAIASKEDPMAYLGTYLDEFNALVLQNRNLLSSPKVQDTMLMLAAEIVFPQVAAVSLGEMEAWFQKLGLLLPSINGTMLELLPRDLPCPYYQAFIKAMGDIYSSLSARKRQDVYGFQKGYLAAQFADSGSACDAGTTGVRSWLLQNLGDFCSAAKLSELQALYPKLDSLANPTTLSPAQAADTIVIAQMFGNATLASVAVGLVKDFQTYGSLRAFLSRLKRADCQSSSPAAILTTCQGPSPLAALAPEVQQRLLNNVLFFLKKQRGSMTSSQWDEAFHLLLADFLPALGSAHRPQSPSNTTCEIFQATMGELVVLHPNLTKWQEGVAEATKSCSLHPPSPTATTYIPGFATTDIPGRSATHETSSATSVIPGMATTHVPGSGETGNPGGATTHIPGSGGINNPGGATTRVPGGATTRLQGSGGINNPGGAMTHVPGGATTRIPGSGGINNPGRATTRVPRSNGINNSGGATTHVPGSGKTGNPGGATTHVPGSGGINNPGGVTTRVPGSGGINSPGGATTRVPGSGGINNPGGATTHVPGSGGIENPGGATTRVPGSGGINYPGGATTHVPGSGGINNLGGATTRVPGSGKTGNPGRATTRVPGSGGINNPGGATTHVPGSGGINNPGGATNRVPGSGGINNPGGATNRVPGSGGINNPGGATNRVPGSGGINNPGEATTRVPGSGGINNPGGTTTRVPGSGGINNPGGATTRVPGSGEINNPGGTTTRVPGSGGINNPGGATTLVPGSGGINNPGGATTRVPGSGGINNLGGATTRVPGSGGINNSGGATTRVPGSGGINNPGGATTRVPGSGRINNPGGATTHVPGSGGINNPGGATTRVPGSGGINNPGGVTTRVPGSGGMNNPGGATTRVPGSGGMNNPGGTTTRVPGSDGINNPGGATPPVPGSGGINNPGGATTRVPGSGGINNPGGATTRVPGSGGINNPGGATTRVPGSDGINNPGGATTRVPGSDGIDNPGGATTRVPGSGGIENPGGATTRVPESNASVIPGGVSASNLGGSGGDFPGNATSPVPGTAPTPATSRPALFASSILLPWFLATILL